jgi:putative flippase GtrA
VQFGVFALVGLVGLGLNELIMWALTDGAGLHYMLSKVGATVVIYLWNFFIRKMLLF